LQIISVAFTLNQKRASVARIRVAGNLIARRIQQMHRDVIALQRVVAQTIAVRTIIAGGQPGVRALFVLLRIKINRFVAIRDVITGHGIAATVQRNDAVIPHIDNRVAFDFGAVRETEPDAIETVAHLIVVDFIAGTK
jgi:hypothetical protein